MTLVCGEALVDLFVASPEGDEMPARAVADLDRSALADLLVYAAAAAAVTVTRRGADMPTKAEVEMSLRQGLMPR